MSTAGPAGFAGALAAWRLALGSEGVAVEPEALAEANRATLASPTSVLAILLPIGLAQLSECLAIATRFGVPVHPVSRGCNWGYGSRLPPRGHTALLSLQRLDNVLHVDEAMATARIQPGVTFRALADRLAAAGSRLLPPTTGSGPHTAILGNILERGIGKGLYEDMAAHACGFEVMLANGQVIHTGPAPHGAPGNMPHGAPGGAPFGGLSGLAPTASGPALRDLFIQANLGVVTAVDLWLHPAPRHYQLVWAFLTEAGLAACIDRLRPLLQHGDPWLRAELISQARAASQGRATATDGWIALIRIWGDGDRDLGFRRDAALSCLRDAGGTATDTGPVESGAGFDMDGAGLLGAYSAKPGGMPTDPDPDRDRCGVLWVAPILPLRGVDVGQATRVIAAIQRDHGFAPAISLRCATGRSIKAVVGLFYDRDQPGADARAAACSRAIHTWLRAQGLEPYRLAILDMAEAAANQPQGRRDLLQALKRTLDPAGIIAPGRYIQ
jgi:4-cresol dehydrogenase (hydroxylating)